MAQPDRDAIRGEQYRARRFFSFRTWSRRTDGPHFACADVREPSRLSALRRAIQQTWLERMLHSPAIPLFACPARLLERRACDHLRSHPQRRRIAARRNGATPIDERIARTRLRRIWCARHELRRMGRCVACDGRARLAFRRIDGADRKYRARDMGEPCGVFGPPRTAWCQYQAVSRRPAFPSELTDPQRTAMRLGAGIVCCRRGRFDRATRTACDDRAQTASL